MLPKKKPKINTDPDQRGEERVDELLAKTDQKSTYLPQAIDIEDHDIAFNDLFEKGDMKVVFGGKDTPVFFMTNERWGEFEKTWVLQDEDQNVPTPFLTIRRTDRRTGSHPGTKYNIPGKRSFTYNKIPFFDGETTRYRLYKIPQPTFLDLVYEVKLFTRYMSHVNMYDEIVFAHFSARQNYMIINGHYIPMVVEQISGLDNVSNIDEEKLYVASMQVRVMGYIQNPDDFEIVDSMRKTNIRFNIE